MSRVRVFEFGPTVSKSSTSRTVLSTYSNRSNGRGTSRIRFGKNMVTSKSRLIPKVVKGVQQPGYVAPNYPSPNY